MADVAEGAVSERQDGGPAFPVGNIGEGYYGMTLRDYFASKALAALLDIESTADGGVGRCTFSVEQVALEAYQIADAMLKAREAQ